MWHVVWNRQDFKWPFKPALFTVTRNILVAVGSLAIIITIITILILLILVLFLSVWATSQSFTDLTVDSGGRPDGSQKPGAQLPSNGDCLWPYCSLQGRDRNLQAAAKRAEQIAKPRTWNLTSDVLTGREDLMILLSNLAVQNSKHDMSRYAALNFGCSWCQVFFLFNQPSVCFISPVCQWQGKGQSKANKV